MPAPWLIAFLSILALQFVLLGTRYGYRVDGVLMVQHLTGAAIPPLAFLAFSNPQPPSRLVVHILPVVIMGLITYFAIHLLDAVLALITLGYAGLLAGASIRDDGFLSWAPLRYEPQLKSGLWVTVATLVLSGSTDAVISTDYLFAGGVRTETIAAAASLAGLVLLAWSIFVFLRPGLLRQVAASSADDQALVERVTAELDRNELFRDPDLTLSRLARRVGVPARQISQAVNRSTGLNVSQFVNNKRIASVCNALSTKDVSVTSAMLEAGFFTKSNFNREFRRVTGQSPTGWQASETGKKAH